MKICPRCDGIGTVTMYHEQRRGGWLYHWVTISTCPRCHGKRHVPAMGTEGTCTPAYRPTFTHAEESV